MKEMGFLILLWSHCSEFSSLSDALSDLSIISKGKGTGRVGALYSMILSEKTSACSYLDL